MTSSYSDPIRKRGGTGASRYYQDDAVTIWHGNALDLPLEDESVDLVVTSPP
jgi:ubiquinone/menaquinone biosynthesis C-methylase UbiE